MKLKKKRIGLLGGSFDPIHLGHLYIAREVKKYLNLDEVWFIPAKINPLKKNCPAASFQNRVAMLKLAIQNYPEYIIKDLEGERQGSSYTIDTIKQLKSDFPEAHFFLLLGSDTFKEFENWKLYREIIQLCTLAIVSREEEKENFFLKDPVLNGIFTNHHYLSIPLMQISSTEIKKKLKTRDSCEGLIPASVLDYIYLHHLYQT